MLDSLSAEAASQGAERIFLRVEHDDPLVSTARTVGFFPSAAETLYKGRADPDGADRGSLFVPDSRLRGKEDRDEWGLFRLYNATTPAETRTLAGMTFDQWSASRERTAGRCVQRVLETDGEIRGWLATARRWSVGTLSAMLHPEDEAIMEDIIVSGLGRLSGAASVVCIAADHQTALQQALRDQGFRAEGELVCLVKSTAKNVRDSEVLRSPRASAEPT